MSSNQFQIYKNCRSCMAPAKEHRRSEKKRRGSTGNRLSNIELNDLQNRASMMFHEALIRKLYTKHHERWNMFKRKQDFRLSDQSFLPDVRIEVAHRTWWAQPLWKNSGSVWQLSVTKATGSAGLRQWDIQHWESIGTNYIFKFRQKPV